MKRIFAIYSFVYVNKINKSILFYNTETGEYIITDKLASNMTSKLSTNTTSYYLTTNDNFSDVYTHDILEMMENKYFGEFISFENTNEIPLLFSPSIYIEDDAIENFLETDKKTNKIPSNKNIINKNITDSLREITIHYNSLSKLSSIYKYIYLQYNFPQISNQNSLNIKTLLDSIQSIDTTQLRLNLIIGDISYQDTHKINSLLDLLKFHEIYIYTIYRNSKYIDSINIDKSHIILWTFHYDLDTDIDLFNNMIGLYSTAKDYNIFRQRQFNELKLFPFYTGDNIDFIKKELNYNIDDIFAQKKSISTLFSNANFNSNLFGELTILSNGDVFSNLSRSSIGSISNTSIKELLYLELTINKNWFSKRSNFLPCKNCLYNIFCNPITKLEYLLNKYALCNQSINHIK